MSLLRPGALPTYAWAGSRDLADVPLSGWGIDPAPLAGVEPALLPDSPSPQPGDLVVLGHPRVRLMSAYFHEGWPFSRAATWLRPGAAERVYRAAESLPTGFGLAIWDAWRDPDLQRSLHDTVYQDDTLPPGFVAYPDPQPSHCPPHATGGTADLTLTWHNVPLALGTLFDAFVPEAAADSLEPDGTPGPRLLRRLLGHAMASQGFVVHPQEWWHWEYGTRMWAAVTGADPLFGLTSPDPGRSGYTSAVTISP